MIEKMIGSAQRALTGVIGVVILFGAQVGLVSWARNGPEAWKALAVKVAEMLVALVSWVCDLIVRLLSS